MQARLEILKGRDTDFNTVIETIELKPGGEPIDRVAFPVKALQPKKDGKGRAIPKFRLQPEPGLRPTKNGELVVDGHIKVSSPDVIEFVKVTKAKVINGNGSTQMTGLPETVATYHDDGSIVEIPVYITKKVGDTQLPVEYPARIVSDTSKTKQLNGAYDFPAYTAPSRQWKYSPQNTGSRNGKP